MNILGIIAEFNPLHTGHAYLIDKMRRKTSADFCVVVMSGDYVQRGEPALFPKELRTHAALLTGADLVLELPLSVSTGSAEYFASGAVSLLDQLGCITHLGFGSESSDIHAFQLAGELLCQEPDQYRIMLQKFLRSGMSFPKARYEALSMLSTQENAAALALLKEPNNILGTEYMKALLQHHSSIIPVTIKRAGAGYHEDIHLSDFPFHSAGNPEIATSPDSAAKPEFVLSTDSAAEPEFTSSRPDPEPAFAASSCPDPKPAFAASSHPDPEPAFASASGLRKHFMAAPGSYENDELDEIKGINKRKEKNDKHDNHDNHEIEALLQKYVPASCRPLYREALKNRQYLTLDDFFLPLFYTLQYTDKEKLSVFQDVTPELAARIFRCFREAASCTDLCDKIKTKNLTSTRISRALLHILLHLTKESVQQEKEAGYCLYARILGFRKEARPLLSQIKKHASIPLVSKLADACSCLSPLAFSQLRQTISASELYQAALLSSKKQTMPNPYTMKNEYTKQLIILP